MDLLVNILQAYFPLKLAITFSAAILVFATILIAWLVNLILKRYLVVTLRRLLKSSYNHFVQMLLDFHLFRRLSQLGPGLVFYFASNLFLYQGSATSLTIADFIKRVSMIYIVVVLAYFITACIQCMANYSRLNQDKQHPVFGYLRIGNIFIWIVTGIIAVSILLNKSPWALLTGIGAISAVLLLVFKDSLLGLVASIQVTAYNMVQPGDWIEVPKYGVDGNVLTVTINTVKVQNWDKTIVTIPTYSLTSEGVKNWRGMSEAGGRRIKRSIHIDIDSIKFCDNDLLQRLSKLEPLKLYINQKLQEINQYHETNQIDISVPGNGRHLTNIGLFRAYTESYMRANPRIHQKNFTLLIRQLEPGPDGLPLEIYAFSNDTNWNNYESIQADIFDHLLAILPQFELKAYQNATTLTLPKN